MENHVNHHQKRTHEELLAHIRQHDIDAELVFDIGDTPTVPAAAAALGVDTGQIIKTLLFLVEQINQPGKPEQPVIVISNGENRVDKRPLADHFGVGKKRIKLASADIVLTILGYPAGGVPPFGHRTKLPVILDATVLDVATQYGGIVYGGGGDDRTMIKLTTEELQRVVQPLVLELSSS